MLGTSKSDFKASLERTLKRYHGIIAGVLFASGIFLRLLATNYPGLVWQVIGDFGTFLAGAIAIPFIYERFIKSEDRRLFLSDLEEVLESKLASYGHRQKSPVIHELGRLTVRDKVAFLQSAKSEVIEVGIALRSLVGYFEQRPAHEFKEPVMDLLRKGVNFKFLALDPDSAVAKTYIQDRGEPELDGNIRRSLEKLCRLRDEFRNVGLPGAFEIYTYAHFPYCYIMLVDPKEPNGRAHISHYMYGTKRSETPIVEVHKSANPLLFEKYREMVTNLLAVSKKL
jgi:hypothetical protein